MRRPRCKRVLQRQEAGHQVPTRRRRSGRQQIDSDLRIEFKAFVCNTDSIKIVASRNVSPVDQALIEASLEHQLLQTFGIKVQQGTAYDILVKGYVREANTGIAIYVDKRFTNAANTIYKAKPEPVGEFPADSLGN